MKTKIKLLLILMGGLGLVFLFSGCSIIGSGIGFGIGAVKDAHIPKYKYILPISQIGELKTNAKIELVHKNGSHINGKYAGRAFIELESYSEKYEKSLNQLRGRIVLPQIGDSVKIELVHQFSNKYVIRKFIGFDHRRILVQHNDGTGLVAIENFKTMSDFKGNMLLKEAIINLIENGEVPCFSMILVKDKQTVHEILTEDISQIRILPYKRKKWIGLGVGLGVGAVIDIGCVLILGHIIFKDFNMNIRM